jgi:hypothetical protein
MATQLSEEEKLNDGTNAVYYLEQFNKWKNIAQDLTDQDYTNRENIFKANQEIEQLEVEKNRFSDLFDTQVEISLVYSKEVKQLKEQIQSAEQRIKELENKIAHLVYGAG